MTKTCKTCGKEKPVIDYYPHEQMKDGYLNFCKACVLVRVKIYDKQPYVKQRDRERRRGGKDQKHDARMKAYNKTYKRKSSYDKKKKYATTIVSRAIKSGVLVRAKFCSECGESGIIHGHHDDYSKPLEVRWLCTRCHGRSHWKEKLA